jgi:hypothetical protein
VGRLVGCQLFGAQKLNVARDEQLELLPHPRFRPVGHYHRTSHISTSTGECPLRGHSDARRRRRPVTDRVTLAAFDELVAVARLKRLPDTNACEIAIVVADAWHHCRISVRPLDKLLDALDARVVGFTFATNEAMKRLAAKAGFTPRPVRTTPAQRSWKSLSEACARSASGTPLARMGDQTRSKEITMHHLHTALLLAFGLTAAPVAISQSRVNEGPNAVPKAETPYDAEHVPTQGNTVRDAEAKKQDSTNRINDERRRSRDDAEHAPTQGNTAGNTARDAQEKKQDSSGRMTDGPPRSRDDAEHAPTQGSR